MVTINVQMQSELGVDQRQQREVRSWNRAACDYEDQTAEQPSIDFDCNAFQTIIIRPVKPS
jgi:hypothetical protein